MLQLLLHARETHKSYLNGSCAILSDTWLVSSKGRDSEEWTGETRFTIEGCARVPAQVLYAHSMTCHGKLGLDLSHPLPALQAAEKNVVCSLGCVVSF